MTDLNLEVLKNCPAVERSPHVVGGEWVFKGTRVPVAALIQNLKAGASIGQFLEWFPGVERRQVRRSTLFSITCARLHKAVNHFSKPWKRSAGARGTAA